jgi:murein tripeptide amidase MpaA
LLKDLDEIENIPNSSSFLTRSTLCHTLAGNKCELLTITSKTSKRDKLSMKRKGVIMSSRVHPGETGASWIMKGIIKYLCGDSPEAKALREAFVFKIVPMLNIDGVIHGNYRTSLCGTDLNRRWKTPD